MHGSFLVFLFENLACECSAGAELQSAAFLLAADPD